MRKKNRERWVEALKAVEKQLQAGEQQFRETQEQLKEAESPVAPSTRLIHIFDREGDIALRL